MAALSKNEKMLYELVDMWIDQCDYLRQINSELYKNTQLYEHGYESNFDENLHDFFAKKITRFQKEINELYKLLPENYFKRSK